MKTVTWLLKIANLLAIALVLAAVLKIEAIMFLDDYFHRDYVITPDLRGRKLTDVLAEEELPVRIRLEKKVMARNVPAGVIVDQSPPPGVPIQTNRAISVKISKGYEKRPVPTVVGLNLLEARIVLRKASLLCGRTATIPSRVPRNHVVLQYPPGGTPAAGKTEVDLLLSSGQEKKEALMPRVTGLPPDAARKKVEECGFSRVNLVEKHMPGVQSGYVLEQSPRPGVLRPLDTPVSIVVNTSSSQTRKEGELELTYRLPPGLTEKTLEIVVEDEDGRRKVYSRKHMPSEVAHMRIKARGERVLVQYYLDKVLVKEETY